MVAGGPLAVGGVWQGDVEVCVHEAREARTVEPARRGARPDIRDAAIAERVASRRATDGGWSRDAPPKLMGREQAGRRGPCLRCGGQEAEDGDGHYLSHGRRSYRHFSSTQEASPHALEYRE